MKTRFLLSAIALSFVFFSVQQAQAADKAPQKPTIQIHKAVKPVTIDANIDEYPKAAIRMDDQSFEKLQYNTWNGKDDLSAEIYLLWDDENLYVAADVTDDAPFANAKEGPDIWDGDCLEILLGMDGTADPERIYFGKGDYQIGLSPGNGKDVKPSEWVWRRDDYQSGIEVAAKPRDKGYTIEAKIPFKVLGGFKPEVGKKFDFDVAVDDGDKGNRKIQFVWTGTKDFYSNPSEWNVAVLAAPQAAFAVSCAGIIGVIIAIVIVAVFIFCLKRRSNVDKINVTEERV